MNPENTPTNNQAALRLIEEWLADDSGYDEAVWPILQDLSEAHRLSYRRRFAESQKCTTSGSTVQPDVL